MQSNEHKFRLHLNLFDGIVLILAVLAAGFLLWNRFKPADSTPSAPQQSDFTYTICLRRVQPGIGEQIQPGAALTDSVKNYDLGKVVSVEVVPASESIIDYENQRYVTAEIPDHEDVYLEVATQAVISDQFTLVGGGYELRTGDAIFVRGPGFLGSGVVTAMERGE